ncbi:MAG: Hsp20/alpha crystallin family protein [bacterium]
MAPELARRRGREMMARPMSSLFPSIREQMDRISRMFDELFGMEEMGPMAMWSPPLDISETNDKVIVTADLPGIKPDNLEISVSENMLTMRGEKEEEREEEGKYSFCRERRYGSFSRSIELPTDVNSDKVNATYRNGVLKIEMQKLPERARKKIAVRSE